MREVILCHPDQLVAVRVGEHREPPPDAVLDRHHQLQREVAHRHHAFDERGDEQPVNTWPGTAKRLEVDSIQRRRLSALERHDTTRATMSVAHECELTKELPRVDDPKCDRHARRRRRLDDEPAGDDQVHAITDVTIVEHHLPSRVAARPQTSRYRLAFGNIQRVKGAQAHAPHGT